MRHARPATDQDPGDRFGQRQAAGHNPAGLWPAAVLSRQCRFEQSAAVRPAVRTLFPRLFAELAGLWRPAPGRAGGLFEAPPTLPASDFPDPVPGPTLRARLGDLVQLTFLNQINANDFGNSIDRGERGQGCDESTRPYPGLDVFPDCFHGSSTGNIHYHGTHTNPSTTGDNVFIEVRPSVRENRQPVVTPESVKEAFDEFFFNCETELGKGPLVQWPRVWSDLPRSFRELQVVLLRRYDADPAIKNKLLPVNEEQIRRGAWPQYTSAPSPIASACHTTRCKRPPNRRSRRNPPT